MSKEFRLDNETTLRGYLAHIHAQVRQIGRLHNEYLFHPDNPTYRVPRSAGSKELRKAWADVVTQIKQVLDVDLKEFNELFGPGDFCKQEAGFQAGSKDPFRITMRVFKHKCDKYRIKNPTFTCMSTWNLSEHERDETEP